MYWSSREGPCIVGETLLEKHRFQTGHHLVNCACSCFVMARLNIGKNVSFIVAGRPLHAPKVRGRVKRHERRRGDADGQCHAVHRVWAMRPQATPPSRHNVGFVIRNVALVVIPPPAGGTSFTHTVVPCVMSLDVFACVLLIAHVTTTHPSSPHPTVLGTQAT